MKNKYTLWSMGIILIAILITNNRYTQHSCSECGSSKISKQWRLGSFNTISIPISLKRSYIQESPLCEDYLNKNHQHKFTGHAAVHEDFLGRGGKRYLEDLISNANAFTDEYNRNFKLRDHINQKTLKDPSFENKIRAIAVMNEDEKEEYFFKTHMFVSDLLDEIRNSK